MIWRGPGDAPPYRTNALLDRQRAVGGAPKVVATNSAAEYWRGDAWLAHGDGLTRTDVDDAPDVRHYLLAGVDHLGELGALDGGHGADGQPAERPERGRPGTGALRRARASGCATVRLRRRVACRASTTAPRWTAPTRSPSSPRDPMCPTPTPDALPIGRDEASVAIVSALDEDGNEIAGVRLPHLVEPVATYTGWNVRPPIDGLPDLMPDFLGSRLPLPGSRSHERSPIVPTTRRGCATRRASWWPERYLLEEDVDLVTADAVRRYDESPTGA